jgi:hypothetical protein
MLTLLLCNCAAPPSIGTQVFEGPVAEEASTCFAALDGSARVNWVGIDGSRRAGPQTSAVRALSYDRRERRLLVTTPEELLSVDLGAEVIASSWALADAEQVWPLADGLLIMGDYGRWTHETSAGDTITRVLPRALSIWERDGQIAWLAADHPRISEPVIIRTDARDPLVAPEVVARMGPMREDSRAAPHATDTAVVAHADEQSIVISSSSGSFSLPHDGARLTALLWLTDNLYVAAFEERAGVALVDIGLHEIRYLENLTGPLAGPIPCSATIPLP